MALPAQRSPSRFLQELRTALIADAEDELQMALRVAVLLALGCSRPEVRKKLDVAAPALRAAEARLKRGLGGSRDP